MTAMGRKRPSPLLARSGHSRSELGRAADGAQPECLIRPLKLPQQVPRPGRQRKDRQLADWTGLCSGEKDDLRESWTLTITVAGLPRQTGPRNLRGGRTGIVRCLLGAHYLQSHSKIILPASVKVDYAVWPVACCCWEHRGCSRPDAPVCSRSRPKTTWLTSLPGRRASARLRASCSTPSRRDPRATVGHTRR